MGSNNHFGYKEYDTNITTLSLNVFLTVQTSYIIVILDFIFLILHQCKEKSIQISVYVLTRSDHFFKCQHNVMLFYINGQEMEIYIHFGENIT